MRTFLLLLIVVVVVRTVLVLRRFRVEEVAKEHGWGAIAQAAYLSAILGFCAYHADWLPWYGVVMVLATSGYAWLLIGGLYAARAVDGYFMHDAAMWRSISFIVLVTLLGVVPVQLAVPKPSPPPRPAGIAADPIVQELGGDIDLVVPQRDVRLVERTGAPRIADAKVEQGEALPVQQYLIVGKRLFLVVTRSRECRVEAVVVGRRGGAAAVVVVAAPFGSASPGAAALCSANGTRTLVRLELAEPITALTDAGAGGPAVPVLR